MMISKKKIIISYLQTAVLLFALFLVAVNTGSLKVTPKELFDGLFVKYNKTVATIYDLRFPRILIAMIGGAAMAVSGVLLQAVMPPPCRPRYHRHKLGRELYGCTDNGVFPRAVLFHPAVRIYRRSVGVPASLLAVLARRTQPASDNTRRRGGERYVHGAYVGFQQRHRL